MSIGLYKEDDWVAYYSSGYSKIIIEKIMLVREGYYHLYSDDYIHDEDIIAQIINPVMDENSPYPSCVGGTKILNSFYLEKRMNSVTKEINIICDWIEK